jgi:hypothetical protein
MPPTRPRRTAVAFAVLLAACAPNRPPSPAPTPSRPTDRVWFTGVSNIRRFACRAADVRAEVALPPGSTVDGVLRGDRPPVAATLVVPVAGLDCGIRAQSHHLHETLKAHAGSTIEFRLAGYELAPAGGTASDPGVPVRLRGSLRIAGVEREVSLSGIVRHDSAGGARLRGEHPLRPTDYGVSPPRRFLGLLRVRDSVAVHFDLGLAKAGGRKVIGASAH